jgi:hypothetical protein
LCSGGIHASSKDPQQQALIVFQKAGKALDSVHVCSDGTFRNISSISQRRKGRKGRKGRKVVIEVGMYLYFLDLLCALT